MEERRKGYSDLAERIAKIEVQAKTNAGNIKELRDDVRQILAAINQSKGGWKYLVALGSLAGAAGAILAKLGPLALLK